jgi:hypothetical protein
MKDKNKNAQEEAFDDVDRLFARLGSKGADEYRDFVPGKLPAREVAAAAPEAPADAVKVPEAAVAAESPALPMPPPPSPPILASIRPLRAEQVQVQVQKSPVGAPATELDALFQRLLQADAAPAAAGPLRRMFGR